MTATRPPGYDDRSAAPVEASRRGAHRARPKPIAAILPVLAGVVVVLLVIGAVYTVVGSKSDTPAKNSAAEKALEDEANSTANPEATAGAKGGGKKGSDASPSAAASTDAGAGAGGDGGGSKADKTIPVRVLNSINVSGLAHTYADKIAAKGWTIEKTGNSTNKDLPTTKIYYQDEDMKPSANAVRKALGGLGELAEDADVNPGKITVVLGQDAAQ